MLRDHSTTVMPNMQPCKFARESVANASPASPPPPYLLSWQGVIPRCCPRDVWISPSAPPLPQFPSPALTSSVMPPFPYCLPSLPPSSLGSLAGVCGPPPAVLAPPSQKQLLTMNKNRPQPLLVIQVERVQTYHSDQVSHRESAKSGVGVLRGKGNRGLATPRTTHGPRKGSCVLLGTVCRLAQQHAILEQPLPNSPPNSEITSLKPVQHPCLHLFRPPGWLSRMSPPVRLVSVLLTYCSSARLRRSMGSVG